MSASEKTPFASLVQEALRARHEQPTNQKELAHLLGLQPSQLSEHLSGKRPASPEFAVQIAEAVCLPVDLALLANAATTCTLPTTNSPDTHRRTREAREFFLSLFKERSAQTTESAGSFTSFTTLSFEEDEWCVIAGDRRDEDPEGLGDLIARSVSSGDLMFLPALGLPADTTVRSDKSVLSDFTGENPHLIRNLLIVGSAAVNLATRAVLRKAGASFMFNIGRDAFDREAILTSEIGDALRYNPKQLRSARDSSRQQITNLLVAFSKSGFVDPVHFQDIRGRETPGSRDYGIVAVAPNIWAPPESKRIAVICAGTKGPGTAGALQMLANRDQFKKHPLGGVFQVTTSRQAHWDIRYDHLYPEWDTHEYDIHQYIERLRAMADAVRRKQAPFDAVVVPPETLDSVCAFIARLDLGEATA